LTDKNTPEVISKIVDNNLCTGCGICVTECENTLSMDFNKNGFYVPIQINDCDSLSNCIKVCPFNDKPIKELANEDEINKSLNRDKFKKNEHLGNYLNLYAGHSIKHRKTSSSGGIATYVLSELLRNGEIDYVISVKKNLASGDSIYEYALSGSVDQVNNSSKTKYYPVTLAKVLKIIEEKDANFAITGVPCFVKGIRLKQFKNEIYKKRIKFVVGIFCGGLKSKFYTDYLINKTNYTPNKTQDITPLYRIKEAKSSGSSDYSFGVESQNKTISKVKMKSLPEMWGTGLFKANACDFCDDLCAENADLSIGDAWIKPYVNDGLGDNIVITRSELAEKYIQLGIENKELNLDLISSDLAVKSQSGNVTHRKKGLKLRLFLEAISSRKNRKNNIIIKKRVKPSPFFGVSFWIVQILRRKVRKKSLDLWRESENINQFESLISNDLKYLKIYTKIHQIIRKFYIKNIVKKIKTLL
jgi:coenzyme F420-reducing hydrogenase beta subunit